jgi:2-amino-4-hydroxy-6-hydroxymethyldihydropteridine diphosphokinase
MKHTVVFLLGGNIGDVRASIIEAQSQLSMFIGECVAASSFYSSEAWGFESAQKFVNQVLIYKTDVSPHECLQHALNIEQQCGRIRNKIGTYESRIIDIDILFYDSEIIETDSLTIPHPHMHNRRFTLVPLCELVPDFTHPVLKKTQQELLKQCNDVGYVEIC